MNFLQAFQVQESGDFNLFPDSFRFYDLEPASWLDLSAESILSSTISPETLPNSSPEFASDEPVYNSSGSLESKDRADFHDVSMDQDKTTSNAIKKRKFVSRVTQACDACRKRKTRCSGQVPCEYCTLTNQNCTVSPGKRIASAKKSPQNTISNSKQPPTTYVQALESQCQALTDAIQQLAIQTKVSLDGMDWDAIADVSFDSNKTSQSGDYLWNEKIKLIRAKITETFSETTTPEHINSGSVDIPEPTKLDGLEKDNEDRNMHYMGRGSDFAFADNVTVNYTDIQPTSCLEIGKDSKFFCEIGKNTSPTSMLVSIRRKYLNAVDSPPPSLELQRTLLDAYFDRINSLFPVIHRAQFEREYQSDLLETDYAFKALVYAMFALASRYVDEVEMPPIPPDVPEATGPYAPYSARGWQFYRFSFLYSKMTSMLSGRLGDLQANTLQILWLVTACNPGCAWITIGVYIRRAIDAGIHVEKGRWQRSVIEDQIRKRIFHILLTFDRTLSSAAGRPLAFHYEECDVSYPLDLSDEALEEWDRACQDYEKDNPNATVEGRPPPPACCPPYNPGPVLTTVKLNELQKVLVKITRTVYGRRGWYEQIRCQQVHPSEFLPELDTFEKLLDAWYDDLVIGLRWRASLPENPFLLSTILHSHYYFARLLLYRELLTPFVTSNEQQRAHLNTRPFPFELLERCGKWVQELLSMYSTVSRRDLWRSCTSYAPSHLLSSSMTSLFIGAMNQNLSGISMVESQEFQNARTLILFIDQMAPYHPLAYKLSTNAQMFAPKSRYAGGRLANKLFCIS